MFLAVTRLPQRSDALAAAARATGVALPDARHRLAGMLPRVLLLHNDHHELRILQANLAREEILSVVVDPAKAPGDTNRVMVRRIVAEGDDLIITSGVGTETTQRVHRDDLVLLQRGTRTHVSMKTETTTEKKFSAGMAAATGGLVMSKTVKSTATQTTTEKECFAILHRNGEEPDLVFYQNKLDYQFLGPKLQPSRFANFQQMVALLRGFAPALPFDERPGQPGLVNALPAMSADPVDVLLHMIHLGHKAEKNFAAGLPLP